VEKYQIIVYTGTSGTGPVRTVEVTSPTFIYTAAMQTADFGGLQTAVTFGVKMFSSFFDGYTNSDQALETL
jgi:hypothetical protein